MSLANHKALEAGLEARGLNIKDLGTCPVDRSTEWVYGRSPTKSESLRRSTDFMSSESPRIDFGCTRMRMGNHWHLVNSFYGWDLLLCWLLMLYACCQATSPPSMH